MIAALILVVSVVALAQFYVSYCRSLTASSRKVTLSEQVLEVTGLDDRTVQGDEFGRLLQLVRLCPEPGDDAAELRAVRSYFGLLNLFRLAVRSVVPQLCSWVEQERGNCAYFAAVTLDHRIAFSRDLMARQVANRF